ncbi:hypothetical protein ABB33_04025 [Stenotrophomonas acidaminiphila]|uniref:hypothetical protein n=1 Tax=Stenotrophomonas acidaminiphila TaxID=128780 RepID=UPI000702A052|nr:hypothetical protein [Stenotrophomonas acidaminiphila]KRG86340.1 hypothetical protein ABB33_04025 [Stenotrophomonas acidaminiphila]
MAESIFVGWVVAGAGAQEMRSGDFQVGKVVAGMQAVVILLLLHRYPGIVHDSILYMGQAMAHRWPDLLGNDLFFMYGGQSRYSAFPWLLGVLLQYIGLPALFMWGSLVGVLLFAATSWYCLSRLLPSSQRYWAWLGVLCLPAMYGVVSIFSYGEAFLTSRPFAEGLCLLAVGCLMAKRWVLAGVCIALAGAMHPLQAMAAMLVIWVWAIGRDRRWLHALWLAIPIVALAVAGVRPFNGLVQQADPLWLDSMRTSRQLFVTSWGINDIKFLVFDAFILLLAWHRVKGDFGRWCIASLIALVLGVGSSMLLVDVMHLVLPAGMQLWRVHWLAHWFGVAAIAVLLCQHLQSGERSRAALLFLVAQLAWGETDWGWAAMAAIYLAWPQVVMGSRKRIEPLLGGLFALAIVLLFVNHAANEWKWFRLAGFRLDYYAIDRRLLAFPALAFGLPLLGTYLWHRAAAAGRTFLLVGILLPLLVLGVTVWDARPSLLRTFEDAAGREEIFGVALPENAQIYWGGDSPVGSWLVLHRLSYFSTSQLAGQVFSRETAVDGRQRAERMMALDQAVSHCLDRRTPEKERNSCHASDDVLRQACAVKPVPGPDYLVLPIRQPQQAAGSWAITNPRTGQPALVYWIYSCAALMEELKNP